MRNKLTLAALSALLLMASFGCKKTTDHYTNLAIKDYAMPLQVGRAITYRLDSLTYYFYGQLDTVTSYLAKDSIEGTETDNLGRTGFVVERYLNDTTGTGPWNPSMTYLIILTGSTLEVVENNIRFVKLAAPINEGNNWNGDAYVPTAPYQDNFDYSSNDNKNLSNWDFTYQHVNQQFIIGPGNFDSTVTVLQVNDSSDLPIFLNPNSFASKTYWSETYAKNIGMIYRHTEMWEYEPPTADGSQTSYYIGFVVTMSMVSHN
jgi:hypothetical protein